MGKKKKPATEQITMEFSGTIKCTGHDIDRFSPWTIDWWADKKWQKTESDKSKKKERGRT